ncbi:hypothetical protein M0805_002061 [Coniferiporia weirii]|nr:hypothetical protein M0805_002061 [Coniferiporia weirii]
MTTSDPPSSPMTVLEDTESSMESPESSFGVQEVQDVDGQPGFECEICCDLLRSNPAKYATHLKAEFTGNLTSLHQHIACKTMEDFLHFHTYEKCCQEHGLLGSFNQHLQYTYPKELQRQCEGTMDTFMKQPSEDELAGTYTWSKDKLRELIENFLVETNTAPNITTYKSFQALLEYQRGPKHKKRKIQEQLAVELKAAPGRVSCTYNGWTSAGMKSFMGVTVHWISAGWNLQSQLLSFTELKGSHTGENQAAHLHSIFARYGICQKLMMLTGDNVSMNDETMVELSRLLRDSDGVKFDAGDQCAHCFEHVINLASKAFLSAIGTAGSKKAQLTAELTQGNNNDFEEDIQQLLEDITNSVGIGEDLGKSDALEDKQLLVSLLLKIRGFITKVSIKFKSTGFIFLFWRLLVVAWLCTPPMDYDDSRKKCRKTGL